MALTAGTASAATYWSPWFSEETNPYYRYCSGADEAVTGVDCGGSDCDDLSIRCQRMPHGIRASSWHWTQWFSEEDDDLQTSTGGGSIGWYGGVNYGNMHICNAYGAAGIVTGMACSGSRCDNISLECAMPVSGSLPAQLVGCYWTGWYSEEEDRMALPYEYVVTGVECEGGNCDNKRYYVCELDPAVGTCENHCGGQSEGMCYCDEACTVWGDCCDDFVLICG